MPMSWKHLLPSDYRRMPWKNGRGVTTELAVERCENGEAFLWRISIATVGEDGPFSRFPGCDRWIVPLEGAGMILTSDGRPVRVEPRTVHVFSGDEETHCRLVSGTIRDFNVIVVRSAFTADVRLIEGDEVLTAGDHEQIFLYCMEGELALDGSGRPTLRAGESAQGGRMTSDLTIHCSGVAVLVRLARTEPQ